MANNNPREMFGSGELVSQSSRRSSIINRLTSAGTSAAQTAAESGKTIFDQTLGQNAPELVQSHKDASTLMLGGPVGSMFVKGIAKHLSNGLAESINKFKSNYNENLANNESDDFSFEDSFDSLEEKVTEPEEIEETVRNDDGSILKKITKIKRTGKKKHITTKEIVTNKSKSVVTKDTGSKNSLSKLDKNYANSIISKSNNNVARQDSDSLSRRDLQFITFLSKSIMAKMEKSEEKKLMSKLSTNFTKNIGEVAVSLVPSTFRIFNAAKYMHQLPNVRKVGVFNSINMTLGMIYASTRSIGTETHRLLYSLIEINKAGMGVNIKVKPPTDVTTLTELIGSGIRKGTGAILKSPFKLGNVILSNLLGVDHAASGGPARKGGGRGAFGMGGGVQGGREQRSYSIANILKGTGRGFMGAGILGGLGAVGGGALGFGPLAGAMLGSPLAMSIGTGILGYGAFTGMRGIARNLKKGDGWLSKKYQGSVLGKTHDFLSKTRDKIFFKDTEGSVGDTISDVYGILKSSADRDSKFQKQSLSYQIESLKLFRHTNGLVWKNYELDIKEAKATKRHRQLQMFMGLTGISSGGLMGSIPGILKTVGTVSLIGVVAKAVWDYMGGEGIKDLTSSGFMPKVAGLLAGGIALWASGSVGKAAMIGIGALIGKGLIDYMSGESGPNVTGAFDKLLGKDTQEANNFRDKSGGAIMGAIIGGGLGAYLGGPVGAKIGAGIGAAAGFKYIEMVQDYFDSKNNFLAAPTNEEHLQYRNKQNAARGRADLIVPPTKPEWDAVKDPLATTYDMQMKDYEQKRKIYEKQVKEANDTDTNKNFLLKKAPDSSPAPTVEEINRAKNQRISAKNIKDGNLGTAPNYVTMDNNPTDRPKPFETNSLTLSNSNINPSGYNTSSSIVNTPVTPPAQSTVKTTNIPTEYINWINKYSTIYGVDPRLVACVIKAESNWNPRSVSKSGAGGLMQLMPKTARGLGVSDIFDPEQNIRGGIQYLAESIKMRNGNIPLGVAGYNAGPYNKEIQSGNIPQIEETQNYVKKIMQWYNTSDPTVYKASSKIDNSGERVAQINVSTATNSSIMDTLNWNSEKSFTDNITDIGSSIYNAGSNAIQDGSISTTLQPAIKFFENLEKNYGDDAMAVKETIKNYSSSAYDYKSFYDSSLNKLKSSSFFGLKDRIKQLPMSEEEVKEELLLWMDKHPEIKESMEAASGLSMEELIDKEMIKDKLTSTMTANSLKDKYSAFNEFGMDLWNKAATELKGISNSVSILNSNIVSSNKAMSSSTTSGFNGHGMLRDFGADRLPYDVQSLIFGDFD